MSFNIDDVEKSINFIFSMYPNHDMISMSKSQTYWLLKRVRELEEENKQIKHAYNERCVDIGFFHKLLGLSHEEVGDEVFTIEAMQGEKIKELEGQIKKYREVAKEIERLDKELKQIEE